MNPNFVSQSPPLQGTNPTPPIPPGRIIVSHPIVESPTSQFSITDIIITTLLIYGVFYVVKGLPK